MTNIILTGGGTAGHVTPNIALIPYLQEDGFQIHYIGMKNSMEEELIANVPSVTFHAIRSGKLRRYFSWQNFTDPFRVIAGIKDANKIIRTINPVAVFSKGGFVSVPVAIAAHQHRIPIVVHESDYTPGLANRIAIRYANKVLVTFEDTIPHTRSKGIWTGSPIRSQLYQGDKGRILNAYNFSGNKPILLSMGGSLGAQAINTALREALPLLLPTFDIIHLCGKGNLDNNLNELTSYRQIEFADNELADIFASADVVISRAGANTVCELLALTQPTLFIPLSKASSRGDQILNALYCQKKGYSEVLEQELLTPDTLYQSVLNLLENSSQYITNMIQSPQKDGTKAVLEQLYESIQS